MKQINTAHEQDLLSLGADSIRDLCINSEQIGAIDYSEQLRPDQLPGLLLQAYKMAGYMIIYFLLGVLKSQNNSYSSLCVTLSILCDPLCFNDL